MGSEMCIRDRRGDAAKNETAFEPEPGGHKYASDLLTQVANLNACLLYTSDAADERSSVDLGGRRIIKKKNKTKIR